MRQLPLGSRLVQNLNAGLIPAREDLIAWTQRGLEYRAIYRIENQHVLTAGLDGHSGTFYG